VTVLLVILYVLVCLFLVMVVLLQQGKGADLAGAFGGGGSQTSFGPRGTTNIMHRMTTGAFVLFVVLCLTLTILSGKRRTSVMESVPVAAPVESSESAGSTEPALGAATEEGAAVPDEGEAAPATEPAADGGTNETEPAGEGN
jgi:preprotein translocase subunit SecG